MLGPKTALVRPRFVSLQDGALCVESQSDIWHELFFEAFN